MLYKLYVDNEIVEASHLGLKHRLYVNGWTLRDFYMYTVRSSGFNCMPYNFRVNVSVAFDNELPVGIMVAEYKSHNFCFLNTYVKKDYRRKGVGTALFEKLRIAPHVSVNYGCGIEGSYSFYYKVCGRNIQLE